MPPRCTPLGYLFLKAFMPGSTSYGEEGTRFSLSRREGETILVFRTDEGRKTKRAGDAYGDFLTYFDFKDDDPRSDLILLCMRQAAKDEDNVIRLVVLELKGSHHDRAVEQLDRTLEKVKKKLSPLLGEEFFVPPRLRALIISRGNSPQAFKKKLQEFHNKWQFSPAVYGPKEEPAIRKHLGL